MGVAVGVRLGVFGGTFDPIHNGHLAVAEDALVKLGLDELLFIPAGEPWFKSDRRVTEACHRLAMVRLAVEGMPFFRWSDIEMRRSGPSYTVDTLAELIDEYAGADIVVVLGVDSLREIDRWHEPQRLLRMARVVGMARPGETLDLQALEGVLPGVSERLTLVDSTQVDISGTEIRRRVAAGDSIRCQVPPSVEAYIRTHGLYLD